MPLAASLMQLVQSCRERVATLACTSSTRVATSTVVLTEQARPENTTSHSMVLCRS